MAAEQRGQTEERCDSGQRNRRQSVRLDRRAPVDALSLDPQNVAAHCRRGDVLRALSRNSEARTSYEAALTLHRWCGPALMGKVELLLAQGGYEKALKV